MLTITEKKHLGKIVSEIQLALARNISFSLLNEIALTSQMIKRYENYLILATTYKYFTLFKHILCRCQKVQHSMQNLSNQTGNELST